MERLFGGLAALRRAKVWRNALLPISTAGVLGWLVYRMNSTVEAPRVDGHYRFDPRTRILVTDGYSGRPGAVSDLLARRGAAVIMTHAPGMQQRCFAARDAIHETIMEDWADEVAGRLVVPEGQSKSQVLLKRLETQEDLADVPVPQVRLFCEPLDLLDLRSVARFGVRNYSEQYGPLDVLVNDTRFSPATRVQTAEGVEATLAYNYLGPWVLTTSLLPHMMKTSRVALDVPDILPALPVPEQWAPAVAAYGRVQQPVHAATPARSSLPPDDPVKVVLPSPARVVTVSSGLHKKGLVPWGVILNHSTRQHLLERLQEHQTINRATLSQRSTTLDFVRANHLLPTAEDRKDLYDFPANYYPKTRIFADTSLLRVLSAVQLFRMTKERPVQSLICEVTMEQSEFEQVVQSDDQNFLPSSMKKVLMQSEVESAQSVLHCCLEPEVPGVYIKDLQVCVPDKEVDEGVMLDIARWRLAWTQTDQMVKAIIDAQNARDANKESKQVAR